MSKIRNTSSDIFLSGFMNDDSEFIPIVTDSGSDPTSDIELPKTLPLLPLRNTVLFPGIVIPITVGRDKSVKLVKEAYKKGKVIGIVAQREASIEDPEKKDLFSTGTLAHILKILEMPDGSTSVIIQGKQRFTINEIISDEPYFKADVTQLDEIHAQKKDKEYQAIIGNIRDFSLKIIRLSTNIPPEAAFAIKNIENDKFLINFISSNCDEPLENKQRLLETSDLKKRAILLFEYLTKEVQLLELKNDIHTKVKTDIDQQQREFLLNQHMKTIQQELGGNPVDKEVEDLKKRATKKKWNKKVEASFAKELQKLERLNAISAEYSVQLNYLQTLLDLPWEEYTKDKFDLAGAKRVLDKDHFGLDKVKDRILEHLAVLKLKGDLNAPIICLHGPPGVGKTSLGKSIAKALGRKYVRISLGGLHDEAEIRGHRKTYIGAMPGRIIQNIKKAKTSNPVFVLDEIDKMGNDYKGDPSFAMLEVLDPEQNNSFYDNYLEQEYDLSKVMFIATANTTNSINPALRDRMELINVSGYIVEEKIEIAKGHLLPKQLEAHGVKKSQLALSRKVLENVIENYTRESGVRELDKKIAKIVRYTARQIASGEVPLKQIKTSDLKEILGPHEYLKDQYEGNDYAGVVTGLAWTAVGGEILFVESSISNGKGKLTLTGNLGEVMKESAIIALEYIKAHAAELGVDPESFEQHNFHIHIPEGAIPKDGPSAGITMATSLASALTQRKVKARMAMTGEITLRGKVLPVGGIKEKILAAKRANIKEIILSVDNQKDIDQIKPEYLADLQFHYVRTILDVLKISLLEEKVNEPVVFSVN